MPGSPLRTLLTSPAGLQSGRGFWLFYFCFLYISLSTELVSQMGFVSIFAVPCSFQSILSLTQRFESRVIRYYLLGPLIIASSTDTLGSHWFLMSLVPTSPLLWLSEFLMILILRMNRKSSHTVASQRPELLWTCPAYSPGHSVP